tara:strand:- start:1708 stop:5607 length:3900 start_codon:yes stop_codon:yes gene_type:complete
VKQLPPLIFFILISLNLNADIKDCGLDKNHPSLQKYNECYSNSNTSPAGQTLECYFDLYKNSLKRLGAKSIYERSPLMRDLLSIHRQKYSHSDEKNKILNYYETTELYLQTLECSKGQGPICSEDRDDLITYAKESIPEAIDLQSNHHALKMASKEIKKLQKILPKEVWPKGLATRNIRSDYYPQAIKDCQMGLTPGRYPPPQIVERNRNKKNSSICPNYIAEIPDTSCDPDKQKEPKEKELQKDLFLNSLFHHSIKKQLNALTAHLATVPISLDAKRIIISKANKEIQKCSEEKINFHETKNIFEKEIDYFIERDKAMARAIKELTHLNKESKIYGNTFKKLKTEHHRRCFFSPLKHEAPYYSLKIFKKNNQAKSCTTSSNAIKKFKKEFINPISERITILRQKFPELSLPLSGKDIGVTNKCFKGQLNYLYENPLHYLLYGRLGYPLAQQDLDIAAIEIKNDPNCGEPAWSLGESLNSASIPNQSDFTVPGVNTSKNNTFEKFIREINKQNQAKQIFLKRQSHIKKDTAKDVTPQEITLAQQISQKINDQISNNLIKNLNVACEDPSAYSEAMLPVDKITKSFFIENAPTFDSQKLMFCHMRSDFLKNKKYKQEAYMAASVGIGVIGMMNPVASAIAFPLEMGIEYYQWTESKKDQQITLALSLLGLDEYSKINSSYEGLQQTEIILYAALALNTLGVSGDVADILSSSTKLNKHFQKIKKLASSPLNGKKERDIVDRVKEISSSDVPETYKRELILEILERARIDKVDGPLISELYKEIEPLRSLAINTYHRNIKDLLLETDGAVLVPEILKIDDYYLLKNINRTLDSLNDFERKNFSDLLLRQRVCTVGAPSDCLYLALSEFSNNYGAVRTQRSKEFWKLYKNDPQFYTYLEQQIRKRNLGNKYDQLNDQIADLRGEKKLAIHPGTHQDSMNTYDSALEEINSIDDSFFDIFEAAEDSTKSHSIGSIPDLGDIPDPFSDMEDLRKEIFSIMEEYQKLPQKVKTQLPRAPPKEVSLDLQFLKERQIPGSYISEYQRDITTVRLLQEYERSLMSLRSGDSIRISSNGTHAPEKTLTIGDFLGMGNATHVFSVKMENGTEAVLRLPGSVDVLVNDPSPRRMIYEGRKISPAGEFIDTPLKLSNKTRVNRNIMDKGYISQRQSRFFIQNAKKVRCPSKIGRKFSSPCYYTVKILGHDPNYRYSIVEKINPKMDGKEFILDTETQIITQEFFGLRKTPREISLTTGLDLDEVEDRVDKLKRLHLVMKMASENLVTDLHQGQFVWAKRPDNGKMDWILADW